MTNIISVYSGRTKTFNVAVTDSASGAAINLTGGVLYFTAKIEVDDPDARAIIRHDSNLIGGITITNAVGGLATLTISPSDTKEIEAAMTLTADLTLVDSTGATYTVWEGIVEIDLAVTRSI